MLANVKEVTCSFTSDSVKLEELFVVASFVAKASHDQFDKHYSRHSLCSMTASS